MPETRRPPHEEADADRHRQKIEEARERSDGPPPTDHDARGTPFKRTHGPGPRDAGKGAEGAAERSRGHTAPAISGLDREDEASASDERQPGSAGAGETPATHSGRDATRR